MPLLLAAVSGLLLGSFFNVVIWRLPNGESLIAPGSHCPQCSAPVRPWDNIPVLSWMLLGGKCRDCRHTISIRYPSVELATALLTTLVALVKHSAHAVFLDEVLVLVLVPVALIDVDHRIIPNVILGPAAILAVIGGLLLDRSGVPEQLIAGAAAAGFLLVFALAYPRGMGMGDVKLAGVMGLFLGRSVAVAILAALIAGVLFGIGVIARKGAAGRRTAVPFGPFLAIGAVAAILCGPQVMHWYLHSIV